MLSRSLYSLHCKDRNEGFMFELTVYLDMMLGNLLFSVLRDFKGMASVLFKNVPELSNVSPSSLESGQFHS